MCVAADFGILLFVKNIEEYREMATTSYLYHSLGLHAYRHLSTEYQFGWIYHHVELKREKRRCKHCGARWHNLTFEGRFEGSRFVLLKGLENLSPTGMDHLIDLMALNHPLYEAYLLKEELRLFWNLDDRKSGEGFLSSWLQQARQTGIRQFLKLAKTLERHRNGLLAYFSHRISTGPLEGLNNKIKVLKRQAYGFRDKEYFKLRLFFIHEDALAG